MNKLFREVGGIVVIGILGTGLIEIIKRAIDLISV